MAATVYVSGAARLLTTTSCFVAVCICAISYHEYTSSQLQPNGGGTACGLVPRQTRFVPRFSLYRHDRRYALESLWAVAEQ